jgi:hypothetical protein
MVDPPSARLSTDGTPTYADAPGYEPSNLAVSGGQLAITSTPGIQYAQNSGTGTTSSDVNSQINAMGVGASITSPTTIETTIDGLDFSVTSGINAEQAGLWFGLDEDNYIKLVVAKDGADSGALELAVEDKPAGSDELTFTTSKDLGTPPSISALSSSSLTLRMALDPAAGEVTASYLVDGGTEQEVATLSVPARFFAGVDHDGETATDPVSFAGVFASQRRAATPITAAFEDFSVTPDDGGATVADVAVNAGWNLVGLPLTVGDASPQAVFPASTAGTLFGFDGAYTTPDALAAGEGYWLQFGQSGTETVEGTETTTVSSDLTTGWNLVTGPSCSVPLSSVADPSGVVAPGTLFGFNGAYTTPTTLEPGQGYWLQATGAGTITFDCSTAPTEATLATATASATATPDHMALTVADAADRRQTLYVGAAPEGRSYALPPPPPEGAFDARFDDDTRLLTESKGLVRLQSDRYPLTVTLTDAGASATADRPGLLVDVLDGSGVVATHELERATASFTVRDPAATTLRVRAREDLPSSFALHGNYPNPFVDRTTVAFDLPEDAEVRLEVYDLLGRRVVSTSRRLSAGARQTVSLDGRRLTTGAYFYRLHAEMASGTVTKTGRMTLVK